MIGLLQRTNAKGRRALLAYYLVRQQVLQHNRYVLAVQEIRDRGWQWRPISVRQEAMFNLYVVDRSQRHGLDAK